MWKKKSWQQFLACKNMYYTALFLNSTFEKWLSHLHFTAFGAFAFGLHGFHHYKPEGRGRRENRGGQNLHVAFWLTLNKEDKKSNDEAVATMYNSLWNPHLPAGPGCLGTFTGKADKPLIHSSFLLSLFLWLQRLFGKETIFLTPVSNF